MSESLESQDVMDTDALGKIWKEMDPQDFDAFIAKHVGYKNRGSRSRRR